MFNLLPLGLVFLTSVTTTEFRVADQVAFEESAESVNPGNTIQTNKSEAFEILCDVYGFEIEKNLIAPR